MPRIDHHRPPRRTVGTLVAIVFFTAIQTPSATTYMSVEPIPNRDVIGADNLAWLRSIGYSRLELWSQRLLSECHVVDNVIDTLTAHGAITTVTTQSNTRFVVAAGGFEGETNPSYVFTVQDAGRGAVSAADVNVFDNALGYVLNRAEPCISVPTTPGPMRLRSTMPSSRFRGH